jgi:hypothetical protein
VSWVVLADPGGNEFDVLRPLPADDAADTGNVTGVAG